MHPIYSIRLFSDAGSGRFPLPGEMGAPSRYEFIERYPALSLVMADLIVRNFVDLSSENLVRVLSDEKDKMFGIQKLHVEDRGTNGLFSTSFGGSSSEDRKAGSDYRLFIDNSQETRRRGEMQEPEIMNRREKLKLALKTLRGSGDEGKSVTERFRREYPFLADIMEETLVEAQAFLEMSDDEFKSNFLSSMSYDFFKVLIFYYAEQELKKGKMKKREVEKADNHSMQFSAGTLQ
jgi:hypothetical protein